MSTTLGYVLVVFDLELDQWKPFSRPGNTIFWYSKNAIEQELRMCENIHPNVKFKVATVRV